MEANENIDRYPGGQWAKKWGRITDSPPVGWFTRKHSDYECINVTHLFYDIDPENYWHGPEWWEQWDACADLVRDSEADTVAAMAPYFAAAMQKCEATYGWGEGPRQYDGSGIEPRVAHLPSALPAVLRAFGATIGGDAPSPGAPTTLYRFYDAAGTLLYVGIAGNPGRRFDQHAKGASRKPWWPQVVGSTMEHFPDREAAASAEVLAIVTEHPLYNVTHNTTGVRG